MGLFLAILALAFLVFIHELGHFFGAKKVGVEVEEFSIGFPPRIFKKMVNGTLYSLSLIPLGGFVKLKGQNLLDENSNEAGNYVSKSIFQRFIIIIGGPLANLLLPFLLMPIVFLVGDKYPAYLNMPAEIESVIEQSPAAEKGFQSGDVIIGVNDTPIPSWKYLNEAIGEHAIEPVITFSVDRKGRTVLFDFAQDELQHGFGWRPLIPPTVGEVLPESPAEIAGLKKGDTIISIDDIKIDSWTNIVDTLNRPGIDSEKSLAIVIKREDILLDIELAPKLNDQTGKFYIGITVIEEEMSYPFWEAVGLGAEKTVSLISQTLKFLGSLFVGNIGADNLGGPVMITKMVGAAVEHGLTDFIFLLCFISIQLGIFNLLPFPVLDGGHILFLILEKIKGSPLSVKFRQTAQTVGFALLFTLIIYVTVQDGIRIFGG